uniref:Uncharacterized protein n=1 Tax=Anguilla anguilla TaxID=7936 RepID=A0A0E9X6H6_ANGAN
MDLRTFNYRFMLSRPVSDRISLLKPFAPLGRAGRICTLIKYVKTEAYMTGLSGLGGVFHKRTFIVGFFKARFQCQSLISGWLVLALLHSCYFFMFISANVHI